MPNSKQASKRLRQDAKRNTANKIARSSMRTAMKHVLRADSSEEATSRLPEAFKRVDKAAKKHVIHENAAARYKRRLAKAAAGKAQ